LKETFLTGQPFIDQSIEITIFFDLAQVFGTPLWTNETKAAASTIAVATANFAAAVPDATRPLAPRNPIQFLDTAD
jgi:hypothetical protein